MKTFEENFLILKPAEFYLREISKQPDKWQEVIQNNSKYLTNIVQSYLTKMKIIHDST